MTTVLITLFIHFCTPEDGCKKMPLSQWATLEQCQDQVPMLHAMVPGEYILECK